MSGVRDQTLLIDDMITSASRLRELAPQIPAGDEPDRDVAEMVLWNLTVLGEATKRLSEQTRDAHPDVRWSAIARTRDVVVHHYEGVQWGVVRGIVNDYIPELLEQLIQIRDELRE